MTKRFSLSLLLAILLSINGCSKKILNNASSNDLILESKLSFSPIVTLKVIDGWEIDTLENGLIHYQFSNYLDNQNAKQFVNVIEVDLKNPNYNLEFVRLDNQDTLSSVAYNRDAVAAINATYEMDATFVKSNGTVYSSISLDKDNLRFWKHEGALFYNQEDDFKIQYGTKESYSVSTYLNVFSGSPMLIDNYKNVGEEFIGKVSDLNLNNLDYEDYRRHQGVRHPRTVIALTENNKLLLVTIDGRFPESAGMTAKESTQFLAYYFRPQYALNMDGGGSTTMYLKNKGYKGIVNYPTDNNIRDHYGQRKLRTFILVKSNNSKLN